MTSLHPSLVLGTWASALVSGRRVAILGDGSTGLAELVAAAASRRVHAYDPEQQRVAASIQAAGRDTQVSHAPLDEALDLRSGAFDVVIVPDASITGDTQALIEQAHGLLSPRGVLLLASPNPEVIPDSTIGYYDLYDIVSGRFAHVKMVGQAPFAGYTLAEFAAEGDPAVTIDSTLQTGTEEPIWFVVVAGQHAVEVDPYTLVQVPSDDAREWIEAEAPTRDAIGDARNDALMHDMRALHDKEKRSRELAEERKAKATKLSAKCTELQQELEAVKKQALRDQLDIEESHQLDLDRMLDRIAELEEETMEAPADTQRANTIPPDVDTAPELDARGYTFQIDELKRALEEERVERYEATKAAESKLAQVEAEREDAREQLKAANSAALNDAVLNDAMSDDAAGSDIVALEKRLKERGQVVATLKKELREGERVGRELVDKLVAAEKKLQNGSSAKADAATSAQLEALSQKCARYEADLEAAGWKIASLEEKGIIADGSSEHDMLEEALRVSQEEIAALKRQLAEK